MSIFDKNNLLHIFMFVLFIIGLLLVILSFSSYSKLEDKCSTVGLRAKLRIAIGIGSVFISLSIGYLMCVTISGCNCDIGDYNSWKIYTMLGMLFSMGGGLLLLILGIKNDLKSVDCDVDLGATPTILMVLSIIQIVLPVLYILWIIYQKNFDKNNNNKVDEQDEEGEDEGDEDEYQIAEAEAEIMATNKHRVNRYKKTISRKTSELFKLRNKMEIITIRTDNRKFIQLNVKRTLNFKELNKNRNEFIVKDVKLMILGAYIFHNH